MTMTKLLLRTFCGCVVFGIIITGARAAGCEGAITADDALKAEDLRYAAQTSNDFDSMRRLFGDDLVYVHSTGAVDDKASFIERQRSGLHYRAMRRSNVTVRIYGCLAIITGTGSFDVTQKGQDSTVQLLFHSIWVRRGPDVQFVSWESTPAPPKP
jgi:Domain of unknown function (DUF4440)